MQRQTPPSSSSSLPSAEPSAEPSARPRGILFKQEPFDGVEGQGEGGDGVESKEPLQHVPGAAIVGGGSKELLKNAGLGGGQGLVQGPRLQLTLPALGGHLDLLPTTPPCSSQSQAAAAGNAAMQSQAQGDLPAIEPATAAAAADSAGAAAAVAAAAEDADGPAGLAAVPAHLPAGLHHLTRHWLPEGQRGEAVLRQLGAADLKAADHLIKSMGQRDLRLAFQKVYNCTTQSYNNNWLRRKLMEAVGLKSTPSPRHGHGRGAGSGAMAAAAGAAGRARGGRQPPRRAPAAAAAAAAAAAQPRAGPSSSAAAAQQQQQLIIGEVGKKVTRKAAAEAAEADAIAALRTMMAGGMEGGSWKTASAGGSWGDAEEEGEECNVEDVEEEEKLAAEEVAPNGCSSEQQQQQEQTHLPSQQQQPLPLAAHWEGAPASGQNGGVKHSGNGVLGSAEVCGGAHPGEGKRSWRQEEEAERVDGEKAGSAAPSRAEPRSVQMRRGGSNDDMKGGPGWQNGKHSEEDEEGDGERDGEGEGEGAAEPPAQPQAQQQQPVVANGRHH